MSLRLPTSASQCSPVAAFAVVFPPCDVQPERHIGNNFAWRGAPQPNDIVDASAGAAIDDIRGVDDSVLDLYKSAAEQVRCPYFVVDVPLMLLWG